MPIAGLYHLAELQADSANLRVDTDGTFRWAIDGCEFFGGDRGVWTSDGVWAQFRERTRTTSGRGPRSRSGLLGPHRCLTGAAMVG